MRSDIDRAAVEDIDDAIGLVGHFLEGLNETRFGSDTKTFYAVTRALEIISEASRRISDARRARHGEIRWRDIAAAGNVYRHAYHEVTPSRVWLTATRDLEPLRFRPRRTRRMTPKPDQGVRPARRMHST